MRNYILFFDEADRKDISLVGGKGANLGEMTKAGFRVPYGFCITTESYKEFIAANNLGESITRLIREADPDHLGEISKQIREIITGSKMPASVADEIIRAVNKISPEGYYAIRSSATAEDLAFASFAGQQDTYLNVKGNSQILDSVKSCWASLYTDRAILYRVQNKIEHEKVLMSVVVQKMVLPQVSGIMFTADPVSGHRGIISIDAGFGLGEALVSGLVSPDIYKFDKTKKEITGKTISEKKLAILPVEGGGTMKIELSGAKSVSQVLEDSQIRKLAEMGMAIEKHYGQPQDIEWCMENGELFIVQSRAITSLFPLPSPLPDDNDLHAYASLSHFQVMTDPISPLGIDMLRLITNFDSGARSQAEYKFTKSAAGRVYLDISIILQHRKFRKVFSSFMKNADALISDGLIELIGRPDFDERIKKDKKSSRGVVKFLLPIISKAFWNIAFKKPEGALKPVFDYMDDRIKRTAEAINNARPGAQRLEAIYRYASFTPDFKVLLPKMAPAMLSFKMLESLEMKLLGTHTYTDRIVKGLEGNITTEMGLMVGDLADLARKSEPVMRELENKDYKTLFSRIDNLKGCGEFKKKFNAFMEIYDNRGAGEIDMARDRWSEDPEALANIILTTAKTSVEGIHRDEFKDTVEKAKKAAEELVSEVRTRHGKIRSLIVQRVVRLLRNYLPFREHPKYLIMKLILIFKKAFLEEAGFMVKKGLLEREKDIFYVTFWELYKAVENNESLIELVKERKDEYEHFKKLNPPRLLTSDGEEIKGSYKRENLPEGALAGMPASAGTVEGIARVVLDPANASLRKGEILVAPFTDPGWTPLFINAAGLVMEVGGLLTHGTVVAREYGMPAVVGVTDATKKIRTGQKIRVDGNSGYVAIIEE